VATYKVDDTFAWFLALWPMFWTIVLFAPPIVWLAAFALQIACIVADVKRVRAAGIASSMWVAIFWVPRHLFLRTRRLGKAMPFLSCGAPAF
jgi:hypothetical protein